ncbi:hypothetical protein LOTGIDRAFT_155603 [Lottia gigantea]|uniref:Uncharacterized protein n=1 Tax=Lottia gigantea TaxID=225164 RepID=V3Z149_LOTGI|nr:hypothetical protein LOTGIDRAFT_155603 [Lottia gigantea]ESO84268.1 hypothetical protein LOTGIDRAFT_155603 [Lottia gigantea]
MSLINVHPPKTYFGAGDIQKSLGSLPGFPWAKYPGEKHLPGHNYTGPGTRLDLRLDENDNPKHDILYRNKDVTFKHQADKQMIDELENIPNPTFKEKLQRALIIKLLKAKLKLGMGIADEIHKEFRKNNAFQKRSPNLGVCFEHGDNGDNYMMSGRKVTSAIGLTRYSSLIKETTHHPPRMN